MCVKSQKNSSRTIKAKNNSKPFGNVYLAGGRGNDDTVYFETTCSLSCFLLKITQFNLFFSSRRTPYWSRLKFRCGVRFGIDRRAVANCAQTTP